MESKNIKVLAIESSCDETAAAVVVNGRDVRSNVTLFLRRLICTHYMGALCRKLLRENILKKSIR